MASSDFHVLIVGAGPSGLVMALALEAAGIDYTLIEARKAVVPDTGASVLFQPNGARILDQLGVWEELKVSSCVRPSNPFRGGCQHGSVWPKHVRMLLTSGDSRILKLWAITVWSEGICCDRR